MNKKILICFAILVGAILMLVLWAECCCEPALPASTTTDKPVSPTPDRATRPFEPDQSYEPARTPAPADNPAPAPQSSSTPTRESSTVIYTYPNPTINNKSLPSYRKKKVQEFKSLTPSQRDKLIREYKSLPPSERQKFLYESTGTTDYEELLDYYGGSGLY